MGTSTPKKSTLGNAMILGATEDVFNAKKIRDILFVRV
jgi:hypothetical protein